MGSTLELDPVDLVYSSRLLVQFTVKTYGEISRLTHLVRRAVTCGELPDLSN